MLAVLLLASGAARFAQAGLLPAMMSFDLGQHTMLGGDFGAAFPTPYFARLRPDFPTGNVWDGGWYYGPMVHFLTLPLFLAPRWWMVPGLWALTNLAVLAASFVLGCRLSGAVRQVSWTALATLAGLWLWFKPLHLCFAAGNMELAEMALILAAVVALPQSGGRLPGILLGVATMIKFLPVGFLGWLVVRRQWRAVTAGVVTIAIITAVTSVTLGWRNSAAFGPGDARSGPSSSVRLHGQNRSRLAVLWGGATPQVGADAQSITSIFVHFSGLLDYDNVHPYLGQRWYPTSRLTTAIEAGAIASVLLGTAYGLVLLLRRRRPISPFEVSGLCTAMFLLLPWNHQYYYTFALVPLSVLFLSSVAGRQWGVLTLTMIAYFMISPPFRFTWIDQTSWFGVTFFYVHSYSGMMVFGALIFWATATYQMLSEPAVSASALRTSFAGRESHAE
jgi:hypothetical protein